MRTVFMGSPEFAVTSLDAVCESTHDVVAVVTQPARPKGRGRRTVPSAVRIAAERHSIEVLEPGRLDAAAIAAIVTYRADALVVVAYGKILPGSLLESTRFGAINVHPSLLPRHRGASPIQHALLAGDSQTGVTTMRLDRTVDTGAMLMVEQTAIDAEESAVELSERLSAIGARLLVATLDGLATGTLAARLQSGEGATLAPKLKAEDAWVDWSAPADEVVRRVRGLQPWPCAQTTLSDGRRLKLLRARVQTGEAVGVSAVGEVVAAAASGIVIACGRGCVVLLEAQPQGKRAMSAADLANGRQLVAGDRLGV